MDRETLIKIARDIAVNEGGGEFLEFDGTLSFNGLNQKTYDAYRRRIKKPIQDVRQSTFGEFLDVLENDFVNNNGIKNLPEDILPIVVDMSFNSGPGNAARTVQRLVGAEEDGIIGPKTLAAIDEYRKENSFVDGFSNQRTQFLLDSNSDSVKQNLNGLLNRVENVREMYKSTDDVIVKPIESSDSVTVEEVTDG